MSTKHAPVARVRDAATLATSRARSGARRIGRDARAIVRGVEEIGDAATGELEDLRDRVGDYVTRSGRGIGDAWRACRRSVQEHPYNSVLIAAGVGVMAAGAGWLFGRLRKGR